MKKISTPTLLARVTVVVVLLQLSGIVHAQTWSLFGISGMQQSSDQTGTNLWDHMDHTLFRINTTNGRLTQVTVMPWVLDSQTIAYCSANGLLYHTGGDGAYRDDPAREVHDQDPNVVIGGGAYQDNQYMGTYNLLTHTMAGVYNANPCPNPDNAANDIGNDGLYLPCFGLPAPVPPWVEPQYRRDSTMIDPTNRITGPNEPSGIHGTAWSSELNSWYVTDGALYKMSLDGMTCTKIGTPTFQIPTDDLTTYTNGLRPVADLKALAFMKVGGQTKLFGTWRDDAGTISGNTNGWIMEIDPVTGTNVAQIAVHPPPGGSPVGNGDEFGGLLGLAQNPQTGVVYGIRKTDDVFSRELVTIDLATGDSTLVGILQDVDNFGQAITTLAFAPDILITSISQSGSALTINWTGAAGPSFSLQTAASLGPSATWTTVASGLSGPSTTTSITNSLGFFKISKP